MNYVISNFQNEFIFWKQIIIRYCQGGNWPSATIVYPLDLKVQDKSSNVKTPKPMQQMQV
jgi:hypothetical protein